MLAQFFRSPAHIGGNRLAQGGEFADRLTEAATDAGFSLGWRRGFEWQTGNAAQFLLQPDPHHASLLAQRCRGHIPQGEGSGHAPQSAPAGQLAADPPHLIYRHARQPGIWISHGAQIKDPLHLAFSQPIGEFGQHLGGTDSHRHR